MAVVVVLLMCSWGIVQSWQHQMKFFISEVALLGVIFLCLLIRQYTGKDTLMDANPSLMIGQCTTETALEDLEKGIPEEMEQTIQRQISQTITGIRPVESSDETVQVASAPGLMDNEEDERGAVSARPLLKHDGPLPPGLLDEEENNDVVSARPLLKHDGPLPPGLLEEEDNDVVSARPLLKHDGPLPPGLLDEENNDVVSARPLLKHDGPLPPGLLDEEKNNDVVSARPLLKHDGPLPAGLLDNGEDNLDILVIRAEHFTQEAPESMDEQIRGLSLQAFEEDALEELQLKLENAAEKKMEWFVLALWSDGCLRGFATFSIMPWQRSCSSSMGELATAVPHLAVAPEFRGLGFGNRLLDVIVSQGRRFGCWAVKLCSLDATLPFYMKYGFHIDNTKQPEPDDTGMEFLL